MSLLYRLLTRFGSFWDGAVLPMGLGLSLVINGLFIARHINKVGELLGVRSNIIELCSEKRA